jgi:hypothetical protein
MMDAIRKAARDLPPSAPRLRLEAVLGALPPAPSLEPQIRDIRVQRLLIPVAPGYSVPAVLVRPEGAVNGVVVAVDDQRKEAVASDPIIAEILKRGWAVCGMDPRGIGELATTKPTWVFAVTLLSGENFVWQQAHDISQTARYLGASGLFGRRIALYARGPNAALAATYAVGQNSQARSFTLPWFVLRDGFVSYWQFLERPKSLPVSFRLHAGERDRRKRLDREIPAIYMPFDALRSFDLPQLLEASPARGLVIDPISGDWEPMPEGAARKLLPPSVQVVSTANQEQTLSALAEMLKSQ